MKTQPRFAGALAIATAFAIPAVAATTAGPSAIAPANTTLTTPRTDLPLCSDLAKSNAGMASSASTRANPNTSGAHQDCAPNSGTPATAATPASGLTPLPNIGAKPDVMAPRTATTPPNPAPSVSANTNAQGTTTR